VLKAGPAPNYWLGTPDNVTVDAEGNLHLVAQKILGRWYCSAITSTKSDFGYGTYRFVMSTPLENFDPNAVVGMFTYNSAPGNGHQEVDVELSRWGVPSPTAPNAQYVVQPYRRGKNHIHTFLAPPGTGMTYEFTWTPTGVTFNLYNGTTPDAPRVRTWHTKAVPGEPQAGTHVNLNMWLMAAHPPYNGTKQEVVFQSFSYTPAAA
jgi:endo-1,3-1,4-beta-glycanase ExoK